jgi:hypothetical protein
MHMLLVVYGKGSNLCCTYKNGHREKSSIESPLDSTDRWPSGLRRQLKVLSSGLINNRWSERAWVQIPLCSTYLLMFILILFRTRRIGYTFLNNAEQNRTNF